MPKIVDDEDLPPSDIWQEPLEGFGWVSQMLHYSAPGVPERTWVHVMPINDTHLHRLCRTCWCEPVQDAEQPDVYIHNSADQRERFEPRPGRALLN